MHLSAKQAAAVCCCCRLRSYQVVGYHGSGRVTYEEALAAVFIESWIFLFISLIGLRGRMIELVPKHIMLATAVGIGLFLSHIGFQQAEGIGLITFDPATLVALGELTVF
jgi:AGZA family xanthine/uracil permease-like MFS transporter